MRKKGRYLAIGLFFFIVPSVWAGVGGLVSGGRAGGRAGERVSVPFYISVYEPHQDNAWVKILLDTLVFERTDRLPVQPWWFENITVDPPLENKVVGPYGETVEANFFMPCMADYVVHSTFPPGEIPEEIENYVDNYLESGGRYIPVRTVTVSFDVSPLTPRGEYILCLKARFCTAVGQLGEGGAMMPAELDVEGKGLFYILGPPPPSPPIPVSLTIALVWIGLCGMIIGRWVMKKKRIRI